MRGLLQTTWLRLLVSALGASLMALFLVGISPFPTDVLGQTRPQEAGQVGPHDSVVSPGASRIMGSVLLASESDQPVDALLAGTSLTLTAPEGFILQVDAAACAAVGDQPNIVSCTVEPGQTVVFWTVAADAAPSDAG